MRVVVYNIRSGFGPKSRANHERMLDNLRGIARTIVDAGSPLPDVIGLNEVDFHSRRTGFVDQAELIARELSTAGGAYQVIRGPAWRRTTPGREILYGNAILVRHPVVSARRCLFDELEACGVGPTAEALRVPKSAGVWSWMSSEPRGVVMVDFDHPEHGPVRALLTHLDPFSANVREAQAAQIINHLVDVDHPVVLLGDMNAVPTRLTVNRRWFSFDRTHDVLSAGPLLDIRHELGGDDETRWLNWSTYPSDAPRWPIDAVFASAELMATELRVLPGMLSDHLGLVASLSLVREQGLREARRAAHLEQRRVRLQRIQACDAPTSGPSRLLAWLTAMVRHEPG